MKNQISNIMTPLQKAEQLITRFNVITENIDLARRCAALSVYEMIDDRIDHEEDSAYWQEVRNEIYNIQSGRYEARVDKFNEEIWRS